MLIVLSFGLRATWDEATSLLRNPGRLVRSLLAMSVLVPLFGAALVAIFSFRPPVAIVLVALAVSPVPPFLPQKQLKLGGHRDYVYGLLGATALLSIVLAPLAIILLGLAFSRPTSIAPAKITTVIGTTVLVPFAVGLIVHRLAPTFSERAAPISNKIGLASLVIALVPVLVTMWPDMLSLIGDGTLLAIVAFTAFGLVVGHALGGPDSNDRTVLALATATRHPGVALAIAATNFPDERLIAPAVLLYVVVGTIAAVPYTQWRKRRLNGDATSPHDLTASRSRDD
jgi:BASS family bile acid:Na+ symporter